MNIFFYTPWRSVAARQYVKRLLNLPVLQSMTVLPAGSLFLSPLAFKLRSGDLLLLYIADTEDLRELLSLRNDFGDFRLFLILKDNTIIREACGLHPRFIIFQDEEISRLEAVITKTTAAIPSPVHPP